MSAGELRHRLQIESATTTPGASGDYSGSKTWAALAITPMVWARIDYANTSEKSGERDHTLGKATIKIRYRSDLNNKMRITYDGKVFDIEDHFDPTGRKQYLLINTVVR